MAGRHHADIFGNAGVRGTRPLTIHPLMKVIRVADIGGWHPDSAPVGAGRGFLLTVGVERRRAGAHQAVLNVSISRHGSETYAPHVSILTMPTIFACAGSPDLRTKAATCGMFRGSGIPGSLSH